MRCIAANVLAILVVILLIVSCSSSKSSITIPDEPAKAASKGKAHHRLMGLWEFAVDPEAQTLDYYQLRLPEFHLNVLPFMEPPALLNVTLESDIIFDIPNNTLQVDIGLHHPFPGLNEFAGFDVKGVCISRADLLNATPSRDLKMPGPTTLRLLNADGYTRMWNPDEFPYNATDEVFGYKDGLLGAPDSFGQYDAQLNGFKYFCDGLAPGDPVPNMDFNKRGVFSPGTKNIRTYLLQTPQGLIFQYAVDACWEFPSGAAPWVYPDDYPITANCPEAYFIDCMVDGMMFSEDGGSSMNLTIHVYDHQQGTTTDVYVEAKDLYYDAAPNPPAVWHAMYQTSAPEYDIYTVHIDNKTQVPVGVYPALICAVDKEANPFINQTDPPTEFYTAYKVINIPVTQKPGVSVTIEEDADLKGYPYFNTPIDYVYDAVQYATPPDAIYIDTDGPWQFSYTYNEIVTLSSLPTTDPEVSGFASLYPSEVTHFWKGAFVFGPQMFQPYFGEEHDLAMHKRNVYGITELTLLANTYIFCDEASVITPMEFVYPYYYGTDFTADGRYVLPGPVPIEVFELKWRVRGLGEGELTLTPGGTTYDSLLMRHDITIEIDNVAYAWAILYEWLIDDGTPLAYILSGNSPGNMGNFDPGTGLIIGQVKYMILQGY